MSGARAPIALAVIAALTGAMGEARAAGAAGASGETRAGEAPPIQDNSFLIEEAYNQESRVVQHIGVWTRFDPTGDYIFAFTQEWPFFSQRHQLSYTIPRQSRSDAGGDAEGWGDVTVNYRYQWLGIGETRLAAAPRLTLLLPTGDAAKALGVGASGGQFNLPLSVAISSRLVTHTNAGLTYTGASDDAAARLGYNLGQSLVWLLTRRFNPLIELAWARTDAVGSGPGSDREESFLLSPGFRWAHDFRSGLQIVPGFAYPVGLGAQSGDSALLLYVSFEHGF